MTEFIEDLVDRDLDKICGECGDDTVTQGLDVCLDCREKLDELEAYDSMVDAAVQLAVAVKKRSARYQDN